MDLLNRFSSSDFDHAERALGATLGDQSIRWVDSSPNEPVTPSPQALSTRVCDRCILKKLKCDLKRPTCSRCLEGGCPCVYSCIKKKPGPVKGSRRKAATSASVGTSTERPARSSSSSKDHVNCSYLPSLLEEASLPQHSVQYSEGSTACLLPSARTLWCSVAEATSPTLLSNHPSSVGPQLTSEQEGELLRNFDTHIHPSIPLFPKGKLFQQYEYGAISRNLLLTIFVVTAKILGPPSFWSDGSVEDCVKYLLQTNVIDKDSPSTRLSLNDFRQACLLAFYAFHQYPGERAWMRIGHLTRRAYQCGLHQIDVRDRCLAFDHNPISDEQAEEWRYVWWCIYCLDSYSNITAATPFVVEIESVKTALVTTSFADLADNRPDLTSPKFLPAETRLLWMTTRDITSNGGDFNFNVHIVTTTLLREAATIYRLRAQNPSERLQARQAALEDHLSAVRLALPTRYLSGARNALIDESSSEHHARLICVLHLHATRVLICLPLDPQRNETEWLDRWQQNLEYCQDIVAIVRQWDGQFCSTVDPAVCFIILGTLLLLHLHGIDGSNSQPELQARLATYKDMLLLFLQQFASTWNIVRFLIMSFEKFSQLVSGPLALKDIDQILRLFQGSLNQRWLSFLALPSDFGTPHTSEDIYQSLSSEGWDFENWEALADFSGLGDTMMTL